MGRDRIGEILVKAKVVDELQLRSARAEQERWGGRIAKLLVERGLADEDAVLEALSQALSLPVLHLGAVSKDPHALSKVELALAERQAVFPVSLKDAGKVLLLAMADPTDLETADAIAHKARVRVQPVLSSEREIQAAILRHYRNVDPSEISSRLRALPRGAPKEPEPQDASSVLDEILNGPPPPELTEEQRRRVEAVRANQEKSAIILRAVRALLREKGLFTDGELEARLK